MAEPMNAETLEQLMGGKPEEAPKTAPNPPPQQPEKKESGLFVQPTLTFREVIGMEKEKKLVLSYIRKPLISKSFFDRFRMKGVMNTLLFGPPGTGKTLICSAAAGEVTLEIQELKKNDPERYANLPDQIPMANINIGDVLDKWVASGARNVKALFNEAREKEPCIMFFDEIDALARSRDNTADSSSEYANTLNEFLAQMSSVHAEGRKIFIFGATNAPWKVDVAGKRSGRFDYVIYVRPPGLVDRMRLFKHYLGGTLPAEERYTGKISYLRLALASIGCSPADIEKICSASKLFAIERCEKEGIKPEEATVSMSDIRQIFRDKEHSRSSLDEWYLSTMSTYLTKPKLQKVGKGKNAIFRPTEGGRMSKEEQKRYDEMVKDVKHYIAYFRLMKAIRWIARSRVVLR